MRNFPSLLGLGAVMTFIGAAGCSPAGSSESDPPARFAENRRPDPDGDPPPQTKPKFAEGREPDPKADPKATPFDGDRAIKYLKQLCDIGPRVSGSDGMKKQQELLVKHFEALGGKITKQEFKAKQKSRRDDVAMTNLIVSWFPERKSRVILCAHYDTRPQADQEADRARWGKPFVSANDGTSGVAFMMELAHHMKDFPTAVGVDFVMFDGEEYVFSGPDGGDLYFFGSEHFAKEYKASERKRTFTYTAAILFDLCMHDGARLAVEGYSWENAKGLVAEVWEIARQLGAKTFKYERGFDRGLAVLDDHVALQAVGIPAIDVIDFDYKHWHTLGDTPDQCSASQMSTVAKVITTWLKTKK